MSEPQQPYGPPPGYGQQPDAVPGWPAAGPPAARGAGPQETSSRAIVALVLAIGSFVVLPFFPAVAALVVARGATREIDAAGGRLSGRGLATAARVIGWINVVLTVLAVVGLVLLVVVFADSDEIGSALSR